MYEGGNDRHFTDHMADSVWGRYLVDGDREALLRHLKTMRHVYRLWDEKFDFDKGLYFVEPLLDATEYTVSSIDASGGKDGFRGGDAFRPSVNSYMYANAHALAKMATMAGDTKMAQEYEARAQALILEPMGRNTAPAIALAALAVGGGSDPLLVMPSDHVIADIDAFHAAIHAALPAVEDGWLVTFGITPDRPATGYGYIHMGEPLSGEICRVNRFVEKPEAARAERMLADGRYVWNAGIFLLRSDRLIEELSVHAPGLLGSVRKALATADREGNRVIPDRAAFASVEAKSID
jgi:hypothetical protein